MGTRFAIKSNRVVLPEGIMPATVVIENGIISDILSGDSVCDENNMLDVGDYALMPGLVDTHVHINEPGRTDWEGFDTATKAAAFGGITTLVDMPLNCIPVTTSKAALQEKLEAVSNQLWVDCGFWGGVTADSLQDLEELLNAGVLGVKSFLIDSGIDEFKPVNENELKTAMSLLAKYDMPYLLHAELDEGTDEPVEIGDSYQSFLQSRPKSWENKAIELVIKVCGELAEQGVHAKPHIVHLSSADAIELIGHAQANGLGITAETCPHYLTLWSENIPDGKTLFKCCPPIRENHNRGELWRAIKSGVISFIVSDHSPCTPDLKHIDSGDIEKAWGGISALQFGLPLIWNEAQKQNFDLYEITQLMSTKPAEFAGLGACKGKIAKGYQADLLVFDESAESLISTEQIVHKNKITPYVDKPALGRVMQTYLRGELIFDGQIASGQPLGRAILKHEIKPLFDKS